MARTGSNARVLKMGSACGPGMRHSGRAGTRIDGLAGSTAGRGGDVDLDGLANSPWKRGNITDAVLSAWADRASARK